MADEISLPELQELSAAFWFYYDLGNYVELERRLSEDAGFTSRSDTGRAPFEEYVTTDTHGRDETMAFLIEHRDTSPFPLRHNITNIFRTAVVGDVTHCRSYIIVTVMANFVPVNASSGVLDAGVKRTPSGLVFTQLDLILDTQDSVPFNTRTTNQNAEAES
jgi:hypothetical protein